MAKKKLPARRRASQHIVTAAASAVAGAVLLTSSQTATPAPAENTARNADWKLILQVRDKLQDDKIFGKFNIGVRAAEGVVTLQGPIPSRETAREAVALVRAIPGVRDVRDELYVPAPDDALAKAMPHPVTTQKLPTPAEKPPVAVPTPGGPASAAIAPQVTAAVPAQPLSAQTVSRSLLDQIDRLRQRDRRFAGIRVELRDGKVYLRGQVAKSRDAWDFADQVGQLPGVAGVVMGVEQK